MRSLPDLPNEVAYLLFESLFSEGTSVIVQVQQNKAPLYSNGCSQTDRTTALSLLLACKGTNQLLTNWLWGERFLTFPDLLDADELKDRIGEDKIGLIRRMEIQDGWGTSRSRTSISDLEDFISHLSAIQSLSLVGFTSRPVNGGNRPTTRQYQSMKAVMRAQPRLRKVFVRNAYRDARFTARNYGRVDGEQRIHVNMTIARGGRHRFTAIYDPSMLPPP